MAERDPLLADVPPDPLSALEARLGHRFARRELLVEALTHGSQRRSGDAPDNQRLEFLGDRVLGLVIADKLCRSHPRSPEEGLTRRLAAMVDAPGLAEVARRIELGPHILLSRSEAEAGGADKQGILADALEAVLAAVYLDAGLQAAEALVERLWGAAIAEPDAPAKDAKSRLQEWAQARRLPAPVYRQIERHGPPHKPVFRMAALVVGFEPVEGEGTSKQLAEQAAAAAMLARFDVPA
ncbi:MAG: ribonuclease III [Alphaproteobacteria bacterium]|nr:ribonuclease III [Alphaproteobacteria bacterium]